MFRTLATLALGALALLASAPAARAAGTANRGIRDIRIVHPPGTPPGTWRVTATIELFADDLVVRPADLSFDGRVLLNGVEIDLLPQPVSLSPAAPVCSIGCVGGCGSYIVFPHVYTGQCQTAVFGSGLTLCGCVVAIDVEFPPHTSALRSTDVIGVTITPTSSSEIDADSTDDSMSLPVPSMPTGTSFCSGDGTLPTPCPCGNSGAAGQGCANSVNPDGALLVATGWTGADALTGTDMITLHGSGMPAVATAIYLKSDGVIAGGSTFGDGVLCLTGSLIRLRTKINVGGRSQFPEAGDPSVSVRGATPPGSGLIGRYQVYYRNAAGTFCPPATFNISNAIELEW
ncbi:MAG: hypothetical protein HZA53_04940 [Planctomycetes bacterium]|nr:hypothetical protein [Planctomycetota bacterium]